MPPAFWLVLGAWLALIAYVSSLLPDPAGVLAPVALAVASAAALAGGARGLAAWRARPAETSFQGQVIARWVERRGASDDESSVTYIAVDAGERCGSFDVSGSAFGRLALGDGVAVRASPRSGKLLGLMPGEGGADAGPTAAGQHRPAGSTAHLDRAGGTAAARPDPAAADGGRAVGPPGAGVSPGADVAPGAGGSPAAGLRTTAEGGA